MEAIIARHQEPRPGAARLQLGALAAPGFGAQLLANLRRNFIICAGGCAGRQLGCNSVQPLASAVGRAGRPACRRPAAATSCRHPLLPPPPPAPRRPASLFPPADNRAPEYNLTRAVITVLVGLAFGTMFWRLGDNRYARGAGGKRCHTAGLHGGGTRQLGSPPCWCQTRAAR